MVSHDAVAFYLLSQEVAKEMKVVQSGQGADEVFGGYSWYPPMRDAPGDGLERYREQFFDRSHAELDLPRTSPRARRERGVRPPAFRPARGGDPSTAPSGWTRW